MSNEVNLMKHQTEVYISLPNVLHDYVSSLSDVNLVNKSSIFRQMIYYVYKNNLFNDVIDDSLVSSIEQPVSQKSTYIKLPVVLNDFICDVSNDLHISKSAFIRYIVNYFYQKNKQIGVEFNV